jgi:transcription initiation factor TFIID subunit 7
MAFSKKKAQFVRSQGKTSKVLTLYLSPNILRAFPEPAEAMADPTQGAFTGLRSRNRPATPTPTPAIARATPTAFEDPAVSDASSRAGRGSILKLSSRKPTGKSKKHVTIKEDARSLSGSPTPHFAPGRSDDDDMSGEGSRPKLTLSFSKVNVKPPAPGQTPLPQSATRTPSIKLKVKPPPALPASAAPSSVPKLKKSARPNASTPKIAGKKRKQPIKDEVDSSEDELARRPPAIRKLTLTTKFAPTPTLKIKHKGKIPKRPLGVGYDSELSDREADPTLLEAFILRMLPGDDCNYLRTAIENGTLGIPRSQGGADVQIRPLDRHGRRAVITIRGAKYAAAMVDLPCIIEGMKSWDKKGWIKSADICQMLLVLKRIQSDEEAQTVPIPPDVNPKTNQYAHGITPPMRWVRKRRFARTNRTQVSDIEAVERKVNQLLQDDAAALHVKHELIDPEQLEARDQDMEYSGEEYEDEEDAEGEEVDEGALDNYFAAHNGQHSEMMGTPTYTETPVEDIGDDEVDEFEAALMDEDDEEPHAINSTAQPSERTALRPPENDSSFAVTSTSVSPSATPAAHSPATAGGDSSDEDEDDADVSASDNPSPNSVNDADKEDAENLQEVRDKIAEIEEKIQEQTRAMNEQPNHIIRKKILLKINALKGDVEQLRNTAGLREEDD